MALVHSTTIRNGLADYVVDAIDAGAGAALAWFLDHRL